MSVSASIASAPCLQGHIACSNCSLVSLHRHACLLEAVLVNLSPIWNCYVHSGNTPNLNLYATSNTGLVKYQARDRVQEGGEVVDMGLHLSHIHLESDAR